VSEFIEWSDKELEDSYWKHYSPPCENCGRLLDHPPIRMWIEKPTIKAPLNEDAPPYAEGRTINVCRHCVLEALAPIEKENEQNPKAGWYFRGILRREYEPTGFIKPKVP